MTMPGGGRGGATLEHIYSEFTRPIEFPQEVKIPASQAQLAPL